MSRKIKVNLSFSITLEVDDSLTPENINEALNEMDYTFSFDTNSIKIKDTSMEELEFDIKE
jgi:hypothetical protein